MKKIISALAAIIILTSLTACTPPNNAGDGSANTPLSTSDISQSAPESDPSENDPNTATSGTQTLDHAYIRYTQPVWYCSLDDPDFTEFHGDGGALPIELTDSPDTIKIKSGDVLKSGLTVRSASTVTKDGLPLSCDVMLDGEITVDGVLCCVTNDPDNQIPDGQTFFFPDPTKSDTIPVSCDAENSNTFYAEAFFDSESGLRVQFDGETVSLGNIDDLPPETAALLRETPAVRAKVTLKNLNLTTRNNSDVIIAELVSAE